MSSPLVSFIIPAYNAHLYIERCIRSICAQTYRNLEILILNDGSTDDTLALCQRLKEEDPRIVLIDKPNEGGYPTRNRGLRLAHGKYIQFADNDDWLEPTFTERLVAAAEAEQADLVIAPYCMTIPLRTADPAQCVNGPFEMREYCFLKEGAYTLEAYARELIRKPNTFYFGVIWNKLYRRDLIEKFNIRFVSDTFCDDDYFNIRYLPYVRKAVAIPGAGYYYYQNPQSICHVDLRVSDIVYGRARLVHRYAALFRQLGLEQEMRWPVHRSLFLNAESVLPSGLAQKLQDATTQI